MSTKQYTAQPLLPFTVSSSELNIFRLSIIRGIVLVLLLLSSVYAAITPSITVPSTGVFTLISCYAIIAIATFYGSKKYSLNNTLFSIQLIIEVLFVGLLAYQTGGAANPFVSYLLVPISIAAATLPRQSAAVIAGAAACVYTLLLFYYQPFDFFSHAGGSHTPALSHSSLYSNAHYLGMWFNFVVSAALISWFVARMAQAIRAKDKAINQQRETQLRDEHIVAVASFAAGTAHELGTPINTLKLLLDDISPDVNPATLQQDLNLMRSQINACEASLKNLVSTARESQNYQSSIVEIGPWVSDCITRWLPLHPELESFPIEKIAQHKQLVTVDETLRQALANILDNASNASVEQIEILIDTTDNQNEVLITVRDFGEGLPDGFNDIAGSQDSPAPLTKTNNGLGIGIMLSNASIERLGGSLSFANRISAESNTAEIEGADAQIKLPIHKTTNNELPQ